MRAGGPRSQAGPSVRLVRTGGPRSRLLFAALLALVLAAAACGGGAPSPGGGGGAEAGSPAPAATAPADPGTVAALRALVGELSAAGAAGDVAACRERLSRASRALFDELFAPGGGARTADRAAAGWAALCGAHAALAWPAEATVTASAAATRATVAGRGVEGQPFAVAFVHEDGRWRVDYAAHPDAPALTAQAAAARATPPAGARPLRAPAGASLAPVP